MKVIDFHTHAFPDGLAERAIKTLEGEAFGVKAHLNGKISDLLASMDKAGIEKSVVCNIATKPSQFDPILTWCKEIRSDRIIPFPSLHPEDENIEEKIDLIKKEGFKGIKLHPFYQKFYADEERLFSIYEKTQAENLMLVMHTGYDIAFPEERRADPAKLMKIRRKFPKLKLITTHLGAWKQWKEVEELMLGSKVYMEISFSLQYLREDFAKQLIMSHPPDHLLFGTDSPWADQKESLDLLKKLRIPQYILDKILYENAESLLDSR